MIPEVCIAVTEAVLGPHPRAAGILPLRLGRQSQSPPRPPEPFLDVLPPDGLDRQPRTAPLPLVPAADPIPGTLGALGFAEQKPGPECHSNELLRLIAGEKGGVLMAVVAGDGKELLKLPLPSPPGWDSMAAARGRLYLTTSKGQVICFFAGE